MRAPRFWVEDGWRARGLDPIGRLYGRVAAWRQRSVKPHRGPLPVVCIGNLVSGGAGKTPTALAIAERLKAKGRRPGFLTRGYGGRAKGPLLVDPTQHGAAEVGDEALLLARAAPTVVSADRVAGAIALQAAGADLAVMDDGFQNPRLAKDLSILVFDAAVGLGNGRVLPAGPLRETPGAGLSRADALLLIGRDGGFRSRLQAMAPQLPMLTGRLEPVSRSLAGRKVLAFAGIGRPEKFFASLDEAGAVVAATRAFPDHHRFTSAEIGALRQAARQAGATLATTEKDLVRLSPTEREGIESLAVRLTFDDEEALDRLLAPFSPDPLP